MGGIGTARQTAIAARRLRVAEMYLRGSNQFEIAGELHIGQPTVSKDLARIRAEWMTRAIMAFDEVKAGELARIDELEREYWTAWVRSQEEKETSFSEQTQGKEATTRAGLRREGQVGDVRFLQGVQWCIEQRLKIFGIYAVARLDVTWREEAERAGVSPAQIFDDMVGRYVKALSGGD